VPDPADGKARAPTFGALLRQLRDTANLTQEELAERAGLSVHAISMLERDVRRAPRPSTVELLASALRLDIVGRDALVAARFTGTARRRRPEAADGPDPNVAEGPDRNVAVPRQLPPAVRHFTGRATELAALTAAQRSPARPGATRVSLIVGMAGVGKTTLAVAWAHQASDEFPDGQLFANLRGFDPTGAPVQPGQVVRGFLGALAVPPSRIPSDPEAQAALLRSVLAGRRVLIVLDNARDVGQIRPLLPGSATCLVLVTSRTDMIGLVAGEGARPVALHPLTPGDSKRLLASVAGPARVSAEPAAAAALVEVCGRLPLALTITAARAAVRPELALADLADLLGGAGGPLGALDTDDVTTSVRGVFSWSYHGLSGPAARMFRLLGLHPGPDVSLPAAASLAGVDRDGAGRALAELARAHLVTAHPGGRFDLHDLLRAYAIEEVDRHEPEPERRAALTRMLDHYLHSAHAAVQLFDHGRRPIEIGPVGPGVTAETFDARSAAAWLEVECPVVCAAIARADADQLDPYVWKLTWAFEAYFERQGLWREWAECERLAMDAAARQGDLTAEAQSHQRLGHLHLHTGDNDRAGVHLRRALDGFRRAGNGVGEALAHMSMAWHLDSRGATGDSLTHVRQADGLFAAAGDRIGRVDALNAMGWLHAELGDFERGLAYCEQARDMYDELGLVSTLAGCWDNIGQIHFQLGHFDEAIAAMHRSLELVEADDDRLHRGVVNDRLGDVYQAAGQPAAARDAWRRALSDLDPIGHPDADKVRAKTTDLP
jgi:tetratricopeptide (TPR) repeat protein/transcriptional regulator with XRE-family HTH domain